MWRILLLLALVASATASGCKYGDCNKGWSNKDLREMGYRKWNKDMRECQARGFKGCYYGWDNPTCKGGCTGCGMLGCGLPTVYDVISSTPELSILKTFIDILNLRIIYNGIFDGTLFLPTDAAMASYLSQLNFNASDPQYQPFLGAFFIKLLSYHTLPRRYYAAQLVNGRSYGTEYFSANGNPHTLQFLSTNCGPCMNCGCQGCSPCTRCRDPRYKAYKSGKIGTMSVWGSKHKGGKGKYQCLVNVVRDEQGNDVTFSRVDVFVLGGGVIHIVNEVLQPNDMFPSVTAILTSTDVFSDLLSAILAVRNATGTDVAALIETTPGNLAAPINAAFAGVPPQVPPPYLLQVLAYHFCPVTRPVDLLYAPYTRGTNPCLTFLTTLVPTWTNGLTYEELVRTGTSPIPPRLIGYVNQLNQDDTTEILVTDVSTPLHAIVAIDKVMLPPLGL